MSNTMTEDYSVVMVIDDNPSVLKSLTHLVRSMGLNVETFGSAEEFLTRRRPDGPACLVLDVTLPGLSGLELQQELARIDARIPTIFISGQADIPMTVRAMKDGAVEFLTKPCRDEDLLNAIGQAIHRSRQQLEQQRRDDGTTPPEVECRSDIGSSEVVGHSEALRGVLKAVDTMAPTESTVPLDNSLSHEQQRDEHDRLTLLLELTSSLVSNLELRDVLKTVMGIARRVMQSDSAVVALPDADRRCLRAYALDCSSGGDAIKGGELLYDENTVTARVFDSGKPWVGRVTDVLESGLELNPPWFDFEFTVGCILPLVSRDRVFGTLGLRRCEDKPYTDDEVDFLMQVANQIAIAVENAQAYDEIRSLKHKLAVERVYPLDEVHTDNNFEEVIGKSAVLRRVLRNVEIVAPTDSTVLIYGETGTGKELIARAIYNLSPRRSKPFVRLNCAAIPTGLLESELFGHEKGAFTGAIAQRVGRFELANGGTLFLDEIADIPLELQPKLLRVLQEQEFERLGSTRTIRVAVRLIAATNLDLATMVAEKRFRSDLYYRLNVFPIVIPPLRDRREDIPALVDHFMRMYARRLNGRVEPVPPSALKALTEYDWPGNVRELSNVVERASVTARAGDLRFDLPRGGDRNDSAGHGAVSVAPSPGEILSEAEIRQQERENIAAALRRTRGKIYGEDGAAKLLGIKPTTLLSRLAKLGLKPTRQVPPASP